jgi:predicted acyl esterase
MAGNSWLAISQVVYIPRPGIDSLSNFPLSQWFIASSQAPSLAAIAPWEGASDMYRDQSRRGGMPEPTMSHAVGMLCPGHGLQEDQGLMSQKYEMFNSYWEDKRAKLGRITCPAYVLASYSSKLHIQGSYRGWREIASKEKW